MKKKYRNVKKKNIKYENIKFEQKYKKEMETVIK